MGARILAAHPTAAPLTGTKTAHPEIPTPADLENSIAREAPETEIQTGQAVRTIATAPTGHHETPIPTPVPREPGIEPMALARLRIGRMATDLAPIGPALIGLGLIGLVEIGQEGIDPMGTGLTGIVPVEIVQAGTVQVGTVLTPIDRDLTDQDRIDLGRTGLVRIGRARTGQPVANRAPTDPTIAAGMAMAAPHFAIDPIGPDVTTTVGRRLRMTETVPARPSAHDPMAPLAGMGHRDIEMSGVHGSPYVHPSPK
jgi:hypothetical protein